LLISLMNLLSPFVSFCGSVIWVVFTKACATHSLSLCLTWSWVTLPEYFQSFALTIMSLLRMSGQQVEFNLVFLTPQKYTGEQNSFWLGNSLYFTSNSDDSHFLISVAHSKANQWFSLPKTDAATNKMASAWCPHIKESSFFAFSSFCYSYQLSTYHNKGSTGGPRQPSEHPSPYQPQIYLRKDVLTIAHPSGSCLPIRFWKNFACGSLDIFQCLLMPCWVSMSVFPLNG
jgi:hypothetical protein